MTMMMMMMMKLEKVRKQIQIISNHLVKELDKKDKKGDPLYFIEPRMPDMFRAFTLPRDKVKVVIIGQDPVPDAGKATGLASA